jgi:hypothetical protein
MDTDELFAFYRTEFIPAYSELVGYIGDKPQQVLIELENAVSHISQVFNPEATQQEKDENIEKAYNHLLRVTLDCYKLLWVSIHDQLKIIEGDQSKRKFGLNMSESSFLIKLQVLRKLAQEARKKETISVGLNPLASFDSYKEVVGAGYELIDSIDENKINEIKLLKRFISAKEFIAGLVIGIFTGVISGYLLEFI